MYQNQQKNIGKGLFKESNTNIKKISKNKKIEKMILLKNRFFNKKIKNKIYTKKVLKHS